MLHINHWTHNSWQCFFLCRFFPLYFIVIFCLFLLCVSHLNSFVRLLSICRRSSIKKLQSKSSECIVNEWDNSFCNCSLRAQQYDEVRRVCSMWRENMQILRKFNINMEQNIYIYVCMHINTLLTFASGHIKWKRCNVIHHSIIQFHDTNLWFDQCSPSLPTTLYIPCVCLHVYCYYYYYFYLLHLRKAFIF